MKRAPNRDEMAAAVGLLSPIVMAEIKAFAGDVGGKLTPENVESLRGRLREALGKIVADGGLPDLAWPEVIVEHNEGQRALAIHFARPEEEQESDEERSRRIEAAALGMWNMMRDAITDYHAKKKPPPCTVIASGLSLYAAMVATGMDPTEALAGAAWQAAGRGAAARPGMQRPGAGLERPAAPRAPRRHAMILATLDNGRRARVRWFRGQAGIEVRAVVTCSGCHESEDGHAVGSYDFDKKNKIPLGAGCDECGHTGKRRVGYWVPLSRTERARLRARRR